MTRKLSGLWSLLTANKAPLASLAVMGTLACIVALTGCGSSNNNGPPPPTSDAGDTGTGMACTTPTFSVAAGTITAGTTVTITATGLPATGFIYYTTDGTVPTHASTAILSGGTVTVSQTETIYAIAYGAGVCSDSVVATVTYTVGVDAGPMLMACAAPTFAPPSGPIAVGSDVKIVPPADFPTTFPQGGASIFFTLDGTIPTTASPAYSGPIQVNANETIHAIASYPGTCTPSTPAIGIYTITQPEGGAAPPAFNPPSTTQNNDFLVELTDSAAGATICFAYGAASTPTCTVTATAATCTGTSQTYNAGAGLAAPGSVTINGGVTSSAGTVTVNAIACVPGSGTSEVASQVYTLQVATPTMQGPAPSATLPYLAAGYNPTVSSTTAGSSLRFTTDGSTATCATGMAPTAAMGTNPAIFPTATNATYDAVGCKTGYAPSAAALFTYGIVLPTPTFVDSTTPANAEGTGTYDGAPTVAFSAAAATFYCSTTDSSAPACGTTAGVCAHGTVGATLAITTTGTVVNVVACSLSYNASAAGTATYTLQLDPPALDVPGCSETLPAVGTSCVAGAPTTPVLSYDIPATASATFVTHVEETIGTVPASATQAGYQFVCAQSGGTPSCLATGCSTGATLISATAAAFKTALTVPLAGAGVVTAGSSWSIIGCPGDVSPGFAPSAVTTVQFALPGAAPVPVVVAGTGSGTYTNPVTPTFTNSGTVAENVCYGTYASATPPTTALTCSAAGVCVNGVGYTAFGSVTANLPGVNTDVIGVVLSSGGTGYATAPTVAFAAPPAGAGALQAQGTAVLSYGVALPATPTTGGTGCSASTTAVTFTGGGGAGATATVTVNAADQVIGLTVTSAGAGYTTAPTVAFTHCTTQPTVTATLVNGVVTGVTITNMGAGYAAAPAVTFTGGGGSGAQGTATLGSTSAEAVLPAIGSNATNKVDIIGCISGDPASPLTTYTYNFAEAVPTVTDVTPVPSTPIVAGTTLDLGDAITLSSASTGYATAPTICYTTDGSAPNPACLSTAVVGATTTCAVGPVVHIATTATTFTTGTLNAIACNPASQTAQVDSTAYTAALNLVVATPVASFPGGTYYKTETPVFTTTTPGAAICYTTVGTATPTCAAGACTNGSINQATTAVPTVNATGTVLKAIACAGATYSSAVSTNTYTLSVSPIILSNDPVLPLSYANTVPNCPPAGGIDVGLDCSEGTVGGTAGCSTATFNAGGATPGAQVCYSTDGTAVTSCAAVTNHIVCTAAGTLHTPIMTVPPPLTGVPFSVNALACAPGFLNSATAAPLPVTVTPYSAAVTFTGAPATDFVVAPTNEDQVTDTAGGGFGYFSTNGTTLYIGLDTVVPGVATYTAIYIGNGSTTNAATATPIPTGSVALPAAAGIQYAILFPTQAAAATLYTWNSAGASWTAGTTGAQAVTVNTGMTTEEFAVPLTSLGQLGAAPTTITVLGSEVTGTGTVGVATAFTFPSGGGAAFSHWFAYPTGSCLYPNQAVQ